MTVEALKRLFWMGSLFGTDRNSIIEGLSSVVHSYPYLLEGIRSKSGLGEIHSHQSRTLQFREDLSLWNRNSTEESRHLVDPNSSICSSISGFEDVLRSCFRAAKSFLFRESGTHTVYQHAASGGLCFVGPSGSGKTTLATALLESLGCPWFRIRPTDILCSHLGESEAYIRHLFSTARQEAPSAIFLDDLDSLVPRRGMFHALFIYLFIYIYIYVCFR